MPIKARAKPNNAPVQAEKPTPLLPQWPSLNTATPPSELTATTLVHNQIITFPNLLPFFLSKTYTTFLRTLPLVTTPAKAQRGHAVRVNDRYQIDDAAFAHQLWTQTGLSETVLNGNISNDDAGKPVSADERRKLWGGDVLGLNPNIRIYRYSEGQFFDKHFDDSNLVSFPLPPLPNDVDRGEGGVAKTAPATTTWTLLIYLSGPATGCEGGETVFYPDPPAKVKGKKSKSENPEPVAVGLEVGMALLHRHGKDCMLHEGREVTRGEKWVIRSDLCVKR